MLAVRIDYVRKQASLYSHHGGIKEGGTKNPPEKPATALMTGDRRCAIYGWHMMTQTRRATQVWFKATLKIASWINTHRLYWDTGITWVGERGGWIRVSEGRREG